MADERMTNGGGRTSVQRTSKCDLIITDMGEVICDTRGCIYMAAFMIIMDTVAMIHLG